MVQSKGTRSESHWFKMDFTGSTKYSGFPGDFLRVSAGGEDAARRAMPTSRALALSLWFATPTRIGPSARSWFPCEVVSTGGQSGTGRFESSLCWPIVRAGLWAACFRSEEHTSELQSRVDLVCRLLLE